MFEGTSKVGKVVRKAVKDSTASLEASVPNKEGQGHEQVANGSTANREGPSASCEEQFIKEEKLQQSWRTMSQSQEGQDIDDGQCRQIDSVPKNSTASR